MHWPAKSSQATSVLSTTELTSQKISNPTSVPCAKAAVSGSFCDCVRNSVTQPILMNASDSSPACSRFSKLPVQPTGAASSIASKNLNMQHLCRLLSTISFKPMGSLSSEASAVTGKLC